MSDQASVTVFAGGQSSRMGTDKSFVRLDGKPLIQHVLDRITPLSLPITLITNTPDAYRSFGLPIYGDIYPGKGPLGGVYTALSYSPAPYTLCVACDMPFLNAALLSYLAGLSSGVDAVIPRIEGRPQALHAVYGPGCLTPIREQLQTGDLKVRAFFSRINCRYVDEDELKEIDPDLKSFININTPEELRDAENRLLW